MSVINTIRRGAVGPIDNLVWERKSFQGEEYLAPSIIDPSKREYNHLVYNMCDTYIKNNQMKINMIPQAIAQFGFTTVEVLKPILETDLEYMLFFMSEMSTTGPGIALITPMLFTSAGTKLRKNLLSITERIATNVSVNDPNIYKQYNSRTIVNFIMGILAGVSLNRGLTDETPGSLDIYMAYLNCINLPRLAYVDTDATLTDLLGYTALGEAQGYNNYRDICKAFLRSIEFNSIVSYDGDTVSSPLFIDISQLVLDGMYKRGILMSVPYTLGMCVYTATHVLTSKGNMLDNALVDIRDNHRLPDPNTLTVYEYFVRMVLDDMVSPENLVADLLETISSMAQLLRSNSATTTLGGMTANPEVLKRLSGVLMLMIYLTDSTQVAFNGVASALNGYAPDMSYEEMQHEMTHDIYEDQFTLLDDMIVNDVTHTPELNKYLFKEIFGDIIPQYLSYIIAYKQVLKRLGSLKPLPIDHTSIVSMLLRVTRIAPGLNKTLVAKLDDDIKTIAVVMTDMINGGV